MPFQVLVKEVKEKVLPEVTDEWAREASEFDTVEELRADIAKRMGLVKRVQAAMALRNGTVEALVELVDADPPAALVDAEVAAAGPRPRAPPRSPAGDHRAVPRGDRADRRSRSSSDLREGAAAAVKADLALRAVAEAEQLEPTDADIDAEIERLAESYQVKPAELRRNLERGRRRCPRYARIGRRARPWSGSSSTSRSSTPTANPSTEPFSSPRPRPSSDSVHEA